MERTFCIGKIVNTKGINGEVKVVPTTDDIKRFELLKQVEVASKNDVKTMEIQRIGYHKNFVILKFKDVDTMNEAEKLKLCTINIPESLALPLNNDEYYQIDLLDMEVFTIEDEFLGVLHNIIQTGSNDVYCVKKEDKEILIPALKQCIIKVDVSNKKMIVKLMEGLR